MGGGIFADQLAPGSPNFDSFLEKTQSYIDKIIIGEGEILFYKWLSGELPGEQRVYTREDINGEVLELSTVGIPGFSDSKINEYPYCAAYTSRSCPFRCGFCSGIRQWGKYRKKKPGQVLEELSQLSKNYRKHLFYFCDSLLNPTITELAEELEKSRLSIYWEGYLRVDKTAGEIENIRLWRRTGFYRAWLGLESGSQRTLDGMDKGITIQQTKNVVSGLASVGIKTSALVVVGYPGETEADFQQTLDLIGELSADLYEVWCSPFNFFMNAQVQSDKWTKKSIPLYTGKLKDMLMLQTWTLKCEPSREESYRRMNRLTALIRESGIPMPYSLHDISQSDKRWKELHPDAVPPMIELTQL